MRGTDTLIIDSDHYTGITPACAGNSNLARFNLYRFKDHPRVCGEQLTDGLAHALVIGSPPRVRGTVQRLPGSRRLRRITPACAGNSGHPACCCRSGEDHPRVCGEQTKKSPSFQHSLLSDQENSFSLKYNCSISSQSFCARWTSLQGSSKCFAKVDS